MIPCSEWNKVVLAPVSHMISLQPLISICPSGDVSKRTKATLMDTLPWAPVHPFHPSMPLYFPNQNNEPFRNSTQGSRPTVVHGSPDFPLLPLLKPLLAPQLPDGWKIAALSAKCGRCFSRISWPREFCSSPPECKRGTLCCHPRSWSVFCLGWLVRHSLPHKRCSCVCVCVGRALNNDGSCEILALPAPPEYCHSKIQTLLQLCI